MCSIQSYCYIVTYIHNVQTLISKRLFLGQKHDIVIRLANVDKQADITRDYGVKKKAIGYLKENSDAIKAAAFSNFKKDAKSLLTAEQFKEAGELLFTWFTNMRSQKKHINGRLLLELFKQILRHSGKNVPSDEAYEGRIQRWQERGDIRLKVVLGEKQDCPTFSNYLAEMVPIITEYESRNIFNADEFALFYCTQTAQTAFRY